MFLAILGSLGIGLVWGWLAGGMEGRLQHPLRTLPGIALATSAILVQIVYWVGWQGMLYFLGAGILAFLIHVGWRRELRKQFFLSVPK
jgi:hypothetical protein